MSFEKLSDEEMDKAISAGSRFEQKRDPDDPRFDIITLRVPNPSIVHPDAKVPAEANLTGELARLRFLRLIFATATGIAEQMGIDKVVILGIGAMYQDTVAREQLALAQDLDSDVNTRLAAAAASGKKPEA